jgi:hypothetical protein
LTTTEPSSRALFVGEKERALYECDIYFREAWAHLAQHLHDPVTVLWPLAAVVLKPDAFVARVAHEAVVGLQEAGFEPIAFRRFRYDRHILRIGWRYQIPVQDLDRLHIVDRIMTEGDSVYVVLRDTTRSHLPGTVRLITVKGSAMQAERKADQLRERLGVKHTLLTFVHTTDEPADLVRDLAVYFEHGAREQLLETITSSQSSSARVEAVIAQMYDETAHHDLDLEASLERVRAQFVRAGGLSRNHAIQLLEEMRLSLSYDWRRLLALADEVSIKLDPWDVITIGAALTASLVAPEPRSSPGSVVENWARHPRSPASQDP